MSINKKNIAMKYLLLLLIFVLSACSERKNNATIVTSFPQTGKLQAQVIQLPVPVLLPRFMGVTDEQLVVYKEKESKLFALFNLQDCSYIGDMGNRGQGPDDFNLLDTRSFCLHKNGFNVLEAGSNLLKTVVIQDNELKVNQIQSIFEQGTSNNGFYPLEDNIYMTLGRLDEENEYCLLDRKTGKITKTDNYPLWNEIKKKTNAPPSFVTYLKTSVVHPSGKKFASFYCRFKHLRIYDKNVHLLHDIDIHIEPFSTNFEEDVQYQPGYYMGQPYATEEYIYTLCENSNPRKMKDNYRCELQVWTWEGIPVACYEFDRKISLMAISRKYNKLYALDNSTEDEIYVYDLPLIKEIK